MNDIQKYFKSQEMAELIEEYGDPIILNDSGQVTGVNQQCFAALFEKIYKPIFETTEDCFYLYDPSTGLWTNTSKEVLMNKLSLLMKDYANYIEARGIVNHRKVPVLSNILTLLRGLCARTDAFARKGEPFVHCANGVVVFVPQDKGLLKPELRPFSPEYMSRNRTEYNFDPEAKCNEFMEKLLKPAINEDDISHLQRYIGQCLLGENFSQTFLLLTGTGGGGKSTLVNIVEKIIKRTNCTELRLEHMNSRFETQRLLGKTLLTAKDVPPHFLNTSGAHKLKALTGKDTVTVEHKGSNDAADVCCSFNAIITANTTLQISIRGDAEAWRRRIIWITYQNAPPQKKIPDFDDYLLSREGHGILRWAIEGAQLLLEADKQLIKSDAQKAKIEQLLNESDSLGNFIDHVIIADSNSTATTAELIEAYKRFCERKNWTPVSRCFAERMLPELMFMRFGVSKRTDVMRNGKNNRGYYGFAIRA